MNTIADYVSQKDQIESLKLELYRTKMLLRRFRLMAYANKEATRSDRVIDMLKAGFVDNKFIAKSCHVTSGSVATMKYRFNKNDKR